MDIWVTIFVFLSYTTIDGLHAVYTTAVVEKKKFMAANLSCVMYVLIAIGVISYVENWMYVIPMALGGWTGTYLSISWMSKRR